MKIFVTGATGFLGKNLCRALEEKGHHVTGVGSDACDLTKEGSLDSFNDETFDQIYHLAVWVQAGDFVVHYQGDIWLQNQKINTNILSWWKEKQPQAKLIAMGTSCGYAPGNSLREDNYLLGIPHTSVYSYGMTKRMLYVGLQSMQRQYGMDYLCLVPNTLYGPGYHNDNRRSHFIFDVIKKIIGAKEGMGPVTLWGDGHQKRELVFVDDFVQIMLELTSTQKNELINIGSGKEYSIREYADIICKHVGYDPSLIQYDTSKFVGAKSKYFNNEKLKEILPEVAFTSLDDGIKATIDWYQEKSLANNN